MRFEIPLIFLFSNSVRSFFARPQFSVLRPIICIKWIWKVPFRVVFFFVRRFFWIIFYCLLPGSYLQISSIIIEVHVLTSLVFQFIFSCFYSSPRSLNIFNFGIFVSYSTKLVCSIAAFCIWLLCIQWTLKTANIEHFEAIVSYVTCWLFALLSNVDIIVVCRLH